MSSSRARWIVLGLAGLAGCGLVRALAGGPAPRPFNHEAHTVRGIGCADCHETAEKEARAGMPSKAFCMNCHEDLDKDQEKPLEKKVAWFLDAAGEPAWAAFGRQSSEIKFSHKDHAAKGVACLSCHEGMDKDTGLVPAGKLQRMDSCVSCHSEKAPRKNDCATCHATLGPQVAPASHRQLWDKTHGRCAREGKAAATSNDCAMCHRQDSCANCHQTRPPADHNEFFRLRGHGIISSLDRDRCATCHTTDSCARCHQQTAPVSHTAGWGAFNQRHCTSCHVPLSPSTSGGCAVCHRSTPSHASAPPKPAWHTPVMNCRSCHAGSLKHPDNGDNCNSCHK